MQLKKDGVLFIGLSGNPFSAAIPFEMFVREILSLKMGDPDPKLRREALTAVTGFSKTAEGVAFKRKSRRKGSMASRPTGQWADAQYGRL